jgi:predicted dehydrogenase
MNRASISRRHFMQLGLSAAALSAMGRRAAAASPNGKLRTAHVGVGGMGASDLESLTSHSLVEVAGLCDVDAESLGKARARFPQAKGFRDFREMIAELGDQIDAVIVSTPDHTHAPAAMTALQAGKAVYCQKPLTHEVYEARQLRKVAAEKKLVTQMGIQVHASDAYRSGTRLIQDGAIGKVSKVHAWSSKNWGYDGPAPTQHAAPPASIDWNLWLGTAAQRPYVPDLYHPSNWRKLIDFGTGTLGDMGVHIFDTPYRALKLGAPSWVRTTCRPPTGIGHPEKNIVTYEFPGTEHTTDKLTWIWYDGSYAPPSADTLGLPADARVPDQGSLFVGEGGTMLLPHVAHPILFPRDKFAALRMPDLEPLDHYHQFVDACLGKAQTSAHFGYASSLTEALLLGVVANRFPDQQLTWDAEKLEITNLPAANQLLRRAYRAGFEVPGLS